MNEMVYKHFLQLKKKRHWVKVTGEVVTEVAEGVTRLMDSYTSNSNVTSVLTNSLS